MNNNLNKKNISGISGFDFPLMILSLFSSAYGLLLVFSATYSKLKPDQIIASDLKSMILSIALGLIIAIVLSHIDYQIISKLWPVIAGGCILLMIATMIWGVARSPSRRSFLAQNRKLFHFSNFRTFESRVYNFIFLPS